MKIRRSAPINETRDVVKPILDYCKKAGIFARRRNVAGVRKMRGSWINLGKKDDPDIWGILRPSGTHFECECKLPGEIPTKAQLDRLEEFAALGAFAFWVTSVDEFMEIIRKWPLV